MPTTRRQTIDNANTNAKKCHCQEDSQEDDAADSINTNNGIGAIDFNKAIIEAIEDIKAVYTSKAAKAIKVNIEVEGMKAVKKCKR